MAHKDPKKRAAYRKQYLKEHREEAKERTRRWREANPGRNAANTAAWRLANPGKYVVGAASYRESHKTERAERYKEWRKRNKEKLRGKRQAESVRTQLRAYGLTLETFDALLKSQGGKCAICGGTSPRLKHANRLCVDHCHKTGRVRGLLCHRCNSVLGLADDSAERLRQAAYYLESFNDSRVIRPKERSLLES